ncbi:hypothetical protein H4R18_002589 [Coemansia javaensis]|uniref:AB hydrolase-1 domain-containing protein n=1 Tax=Coemansia javaensis TaxID=2761396 RepID=A0A9W8HBC1_9FUNG|nr:hypothetical protein H4R18_002589 [Coemansia javaensis]
MGGLARWRDHVDKLLRFNHMTMTLGAEPFRAGAEPGGAGLRRGRQGASATATLQYAFDSTQHFPEPFLTAAPRFNSSFEPSLRHLPCVLFLHGSDPGGFDVARWFAGGLAHVHRLRNPLMPGRFGSYSVYNVQDPQFAVPMPPLGVLSVSRPGYLESSPPPHAPTFQAQAATVARLVESLRIPSVHVVAHSTAAPIALEMAALAGFRRRVRSIALVSPRLAPPRPLQRAAERARMLVPEWARTRAAYNALARPADDAYFVRAVAEICGAASADEIADDPAMARLYEGIGVFFSHWGARRPGALADWRMWGRLDRRAWGLVRAPILCLTASPADEEAARAALVTTRAAPEFGRLSGAGRMLFPLASTSRLCLGFVYRHHHEHCARP